MKKMIAMSLMAMLVGTISSCKDKNEDAENMDGTEMPADATTDMDTMESDDATTVNDSNVSGTTSGEMEQVP